MSIASNLLKAIRKAMKSKEPEIMLDGQIFWEVERSAIDEAAREPGALVELLGIEQDEDGADWWTFLATVRGDSKRLACKI